MTVPGAKEKKLRQDRRRSSSNGEAQAQKASDKREAAEPATKGANKRERVESDQSCFESTSFKRNVSSFSSSGGEEGSPTPAHAKLTMFAHMFHDRGRERLVDLRRRSLTLIDVVTDSQANGPLKLLLPLLMAFTVGIVYWYWIVPALASVGLHEVAAVQRAGGPWSEVHWQSAAGVTVAYLLSVAVGLRAMERREPVKKRIFEFMLAYNCTQVVLNASLGYRLWNEAWRFPYPWGNGLEDTTHQSHRLGMLLWFHYHCRQLELLDTCFIIMRKKFESWSFLALHAYLRLAHLWGWYFACRFACGGDSYFPAAVSCTCQVCVYLYYALSMVYPEGVPLVRKARVTEVQVLQFIICATHAVIVFVNGNLPRPVAAVSLVVMASGLYLYVEWDGQEAHLRPLKKRGNLKELSMFGHMFKNEAALDLATIRRRTMTLIDVIAERQENGQLRPHRLLTAFGFSLVYWNFVLPSLTWWGTGRWYEETSGPGNEQAGGPWSEVNWSTAVMLTIGYIFIVFAGTRFMERRPPVQKRIFEHLVIYNFTQVILNASLGFNLWLEAWRRFQYPWGNHLSSSVESHRLGMLLWFQYHCRQLELLDTIFIILRKKFHHMSFLHIFLRLAHMWGWFFACRYACGGDSYFPAAVNCTCQVVVYLYYTLALINDKPGRILLMRRAFVTEVQMAQFVICMLHAGFVLYKGNLPRFVAVLSLFTMVSSLFLYVDFAGDQPNFIPKSRFKGGADGSQPQEQQETLTFRFDSSGWFYLYHFGVAVWIEEHLLPEPASPELAVSDRYPKALTFSGSSGGALVALGLASGVKLRDLLECVLSWHSACRRNPFLMFTAVEESMRQFLPKTAPLSASGRVRILLTRVSAKPPFITGEVVDQFKTWGDVFHRARATCHVPGLHLLPYRVQDRLYFDGLVWSSLMVPWSDYGDHVVKVSAISAPLTDIRAPFSPHWWIIMPPSVPALRGLFWLGYRDAHRWFTAPAEDGKACLGCGQSRGRRGSGASDGPDPLLSSRVTKRRFAQKLVLRKPVPLAEALPEFDPVTGERVADLIACYRRAVSRAYWALLAAMAIAITLVVTTVLRAH